jgi:hypothetical protein
VYVSLSIQQGRSGIRSSRTHLTTSAESPFLCRPRRQSTSCPRRWECFTLTVLRLVTVVPLVSYLVHTSALLGLTTSGRDSSPFTYGLIQICRCSWEAGYHWSRQWPLTMNRCE